jgi:hypothetical protein
MNRQKTSCHNCISYGVNNFTPWCNRYNKLIAYGKPLPCEDGMTPITFSIPARYIRKVSIYLDIMMEQDIVPDGEKPDFIEIRRYFQECSNQ